MTRKRDRRRIFDHLTDPDQDTRFSRAAHAMRRSAWWSQVPTYETPAPVAGEIMEAA